jgi:hypothetical protein
MSRHLLTVAAAMLAFIPSPALAQGPAPSAKQPKVSVKCLRPGSTVPVACASVAPGSTLLVGMGARGAEPQKIYLVENPGGRATEVAARAANDGEGSYEVPVPRDICPMIMDRRQIRFEIQAFPAGAARLDKATPPTVAHIAIAC